MPSTCQAVDNGDIASHLFQHFCVQGEKPCCQSDQDALSKMQEVYQCHFACGFEAPLLYRFKHAGAALAYLEEYLLH